MMQFSIGHKRWISLIVVFAFLYVIQISNLPLHAERGAPARESEVSKSTDSPNMVERVADTGTRLQKKHFPWLLVVIGVVVLAGAVFYMVNPINKFSLEVTRGNGISGTPETGTFKYKRGEKVDYSYTLQAGYRNLVVKVDGVAAAASGSLVMKKKHTLEASASSGLMLEWLFTGNAQDTSGNDRHSTVVGATLIKDRKGAEQRAYSFNGSSDYIQGPNFIAHDNSQFSISFWVQNTTGNQDEHFIIGNGFGVSQTDNFINFSISIPATSSVHCEIPVNTWTHIVGTYDGIDIRIYRNGVLQGTKHHPGSMSNPQRNFEIGRFLGVYWQGSVDDVRLYSYVLSDSEIQLLSTQQENREH